ncbi:uridine phosphorylase [Salinisphaera sp. Q1T1-3]|uniref:uridine phosphorylase n=1 Tax=Salinisphaera sp. Q1T1-3 TaxID=2321229 RepID=UPI000E76DBCD|nr:uridine phosphorylase [Salinisphaera sp. Q1T1-3]RJS92368.1 uridine phosphorylase [Salinisphaera sp. Q1T1-3]
MSKMRQYHIGLAATDIDNAEHVLLPGDPGRVPDLARGLDPDAISLGQHREHHAWLARLGDRRVLVCSTGLGAPSTAVAVEELANIGIRQFIRVGTTGAIQPFIDYADIVISKAAVRLEGTSSHYAPMTYPAVASFELTRRLVDAARELAIPHHVGITASSDTFWPGQERYDSHGGYVRRAFQGSLAEWRQLGVMNFEMEAAALFTVCSTLGLEAGCLCGVIARRVESESVAHEAYGLAAERWQAILARALAA